MTVIVERASRLTAAPALVWSHATSMRGINSELAPLSMSHPVDLVELTAELPTGVPLFTSTLRLGPVPFDRHRLVIEAWEPGRWFQEASTSVWHRSWRHRRDVVPAAFGCVVTDRLEIVPRLPGAARGTGVAVGRVFDRRHSVLRGLFGTPPAPSG